MSRDFFSIEEALRAIKRLDFINPDDIPSIELYMDQVTTFMEKRLEGNKRNDEDKIMTKTMINNYTKNNLLPPPNKKRYSKEHIVLLIYIYYLKNLLSINDIQTLLLPMIDDYYDTGKKKPSVTGIYKVIFDFEKEHFGEITDSIKRILDEADTIFPKDEDDYLYRMCTIAMLSLDVYVKKKFIEQLIEGMHKEQSEKAAEQTKEKAAEEKAKAAEKNNKK
jgi:hypothetical protein